jgi:hypothetical protein
MSRTTRRESNETNHFFLALTKATARHLITATDNEIAQAMVNFQMVELSDTREENI